MGIQESLDALPDDLKAIVNTAAIAFAKDYADVCTMQESEMFNKAFPEWGTTYIEWGKKDVDKITNEFSLPYLDKIAEEVGAKDPRVVEGVKIVKQFMRDYGYID